MEHGEIESGGGHLPHVHDGGSLIPQSLDHGRADAGRGKPDVAADGDAPLAALGHHLRERAPHGARDVVGQVPFGDAADVVLAEDLRVHGRSFSRR
jgi:hypothetical protein